MSHDSNTPLIPDASHDSTTPLSHVPKQSECGSNRMSRDDFRAVLAHRVYHWNQMRSSKRYEAQGLPPTFSARELNGGFDPSEYDDIDIVSTAKTAKEEVLAGYKWWIIDQVYWYMRECVNDMGVGVMVTVVYQDSNHRGPVVMHENNTLVVRISPYLEFLAHSPACYAFEEGDVDSAFSFYKDVVDGLYAVLFEDGFDIAARDSAGRDMDAKDFVLEGMRDMGCVRLTIRWAQDDDAENMEHILFDSQLDAFDNGVPLEDIIV